MALITYLKEKIAKGETAPRIPLEFACGHNGTCGFSGGSGSTTQLPLHRHAYYEIFLTISDKITHKVGDKEMPMAKNTICLVRPDDAHTHIYPLDSSDDRHLLNVTFSKEVFENLFSFLQHAGIKKEGFLSPKEPPMRVLSEMQGREFLLEFEKRLQFYGGEKEILFRNIYGFLVYVFVNLFSAPENRRQEEISHPPYWLEVTCEKMKRLENFYEGLPRMVEISGKSQEYLARSMKKYYGMTTSQFINDLRLAYVVGRLVSAENEMDSMLELILDSGFQSPGHFYKLFTEKYGMTPKEYRRKKLSIPDI